jgi:DNA (cytosine-5)-methyltransferase 1
LVKLIDLFCGLGGAAVGYARAGFEVVGVDIVPQPDYPFEFICADALTFPLDGFDAVHASPPCQAYSSTRILPGANRFHPRLIEQVREKLTASGLPFVIENVEGAPLHDPVLLCGSMFGLGVTYAGCSAPAGRYMLRRHRLFEANWMPFVPVCAGCWREQTIGIYGHHPAYARRKYGVGKGQFSRREKVQLAREALGIDWSSDWQALKEAIPPAYTELLGHQLLSVTCHTV